MRSFDFLTCYTLYIDILFIHLRTIFSLIQMINIPSSIYDTLNLEGPMNWSEKA